MVYDIAIPTLLKDTKGLERTCTLHIDVGPGLFLAQVHDFTNENFRRPLPLFMRAIVFLATSVPRCFSTQDPLGTGGAGGAAGAGHSQLGSWKRKTSAGDSPSWRCSGYEAHDVMKKKGRL